MRNVTRLEFRFTPLYDASIDAIVIADVGQINFVSTFFCAKFRSVNVGALQNVDNLDQGLLFC
jgi:hypothetical protein